MALAKFYEDIVERYYENLKYTSFNCYKISESINNEISKENSQIKEIKDKINEFVKKYEIESCEEIKEILNKINESKNISFYDILRYYFKIIFLSVVKNNRYDISNINALQLSDTQNYYVNLNTGNYFRIIGASGTGKTVVLLKRAAQIAKENRNNQNNIVRVFTANKSLAIYITELGKKIYPSNNIYFHDIYSFFGEALKILGYRGYNFINKERAQAVKQGKKIYLETISDPFEKRYTYESWDEFLKERKIKLKDYPVNHILNSKKIEDVIRNAENLIDNEWDSSLYNIFCFIIKQDLEEFKNDTELLKDFQKEIKEKKLKNYSYESILHKKLENNLKYDLEIENFLREEISYCRTFATYNDYLDSERKGRGIPLNRKERLIIVYLAEDWHDWLTTGEISDEEKICKELEKKLRDKNNLEKVKSKLPINYAFIDEMQDFPQIAIKIILMLIEKKKNMFFTGDLRQKTKISSVKLTHLGLDFRGKSYNLKQNYRNTQAILEAAQSLIKEFNIPEEEEIEIIDPKYSEYKGVKPVVFNIDDFSKHFKMITHANFILEQIKLRIGVVKSIAIISENKKLLNQISELLKREKIEFKEIQPNETSFLMDNINAKVFLSNMVSVKGYEFDSVIIADISKNKFPTKRDDDPELWRDIVKLYVAITRARDELIFTYEKEKSYIFNYFGDKVKYIEINV